jgi:hypothetical protein
MMNSRLILAAFLMTAPLLHAQDDDDKKIEAQKVEITLAPAKEAAPAKKEPELPKEPYRITINLKTTDGKDITTQKSYTLVATANASSYDRPFIRDDGRIPVAVGDGTQFQGINTDIDLAHFDKISDTVYLGLNVDTQGVGQEVTLGKPGKEATYVPTFHKRYAFFPTLPIGRLTTIYTSTDAINGTKVEFQVLVQPFNDK